MPFLKTRISGTGIYTPKKIVTNFDLEDMIETTDKWIFDRTGISQRRICSTEGGEFPTDMAYKATLDALEMAQLTPNDIDFILFGTVTPDVKLPNCASLLQTKLGITNNCAAIDIAAACSGFVYAINMGNSFIQTKMAKHVLCIGSEMLSTEVDWKDRSTCILFGDGCGVAILSANEDAANPAEIYSSTLGADGTGSKFFFQNVGGSVEPITKTHLENRTHYMQMKGGEMFKVATRTLAQNALKVVADAGFTIDDVDWLVPHQANVRIIETAGKLMGISSDKVIINIDKYGNTSAATVPIAFHEAIADGRIKRGDLILFDAFGAGLTFGATLFRF